MKSIFRKLVMMTGILSASASYSADTDLFMGVPAGTADAPNVLLIIDNTANWSTAFPAEREALLQIFDALDDNAVNLGFMFFSETGGDDKGSSGAYVRAAIRPLNAANKPLYKALLNEVDVSVDKGNGGDGSLSMMEAYEYFAGNAPYAGNQKAKADYTNNTFLNKKNSPTCCADSHPVWAVNDATNGYNALESKNATEYISPIDEDSCAETYIIYVSNNAVQDSASGKGVVSDRLLELDWPYSASGGKNGSGGAAHIDLGDKQTEVASFGDEMAAFMKEELNVTTFTVDINKELTGQGPEWTRVLESMADVSGGQYYEAGNDLDDISGIFEDIFSRILAVNSVFASVALPASANTQSTFINQVYVGLFRPDADAKPRWVGNLKQYKLGFEGGDLKLLDANDVGAIDGQTGFVTECAASYWTPKTEDSYWGYLPESDQLGECLAPTDPGASNTPDGPIVEKGGQAYVMRATDPGNRAVLTCDIVATPTSTLCSAGTMDAFETDNSDISEDLLLVPGDATKRATLINWAIGYDLEDENENTETDDMRPSLHADVVHSEPVAVDYAGDPNDPETVVFYGSNDGMLRAINGNRSSTFSSTDAGEEFWAFMPPESYGNIVRNYDNSTLVKFPASSTPAGTGDDKPYGPDGPLSLYDDGTNKTLYMGMRRGGRTLYAFDVTTITSPTLKWRVGCADLDADTSCTTDMSEIGQTWSNPKVVTVEDSNTPVLLMGGGYDDCEDYDNNSTINHNCSSTKGDVVYMLNANTGEVLQAFDSSHGIERAVVGEITVVTIDESDTDIAFAYFADAGGNVYRISGNDANTPVEDTAPATVNGWTLTKIADFGCGDTADATCSANRKFLFGPDIVRIPQTDYIYQVLVGSGDREKPLEAYGAAASVQNYFYSFVDQPLVADWLDDDPVVCNEPVFCMDSLVAVDPNGPVDLNTPVGDKGWKFALGAGEQVVSGALTVANVVNFGTHIPTTGTPEACETDLGTAAVYNMNFQDGEGEISPIIGGGLVPTPVAGKVVLDNGDTVPFCIGCGGEGSAIGGKKVTAGGDWKQAKNRVYWKIRK